MSCCATGGANAVPRAESAPVLPPLHLRGVVDTRHGNGGASPAHQGHQTGQRATQHRIGLRSHAHQRPGEFHSAAAALLAGLAQHPRSDRQDQAGLLGERDTNPRAPRHRARDGHNAAMRQRDYPADIGRVGVEPDQRW